MILVTAANGNQGALLSPKLIAAGHRVRACVRTERSAEVLRSRGAHEVLVGDLADPDFIAAAVRGVTSTYHIGPTLHPAERAIGIATIDAAAKAGVGHFVLSSVLHAITTDLIQHEIKRDLEEHLLSSGLRYTILQPANYMLPHRLATVFEEGVFRLPWSLERRQSMVDLDDVTDVAALALAEPERHAAATYELVGPDRFTVSDVLDPPCWGDLGLRVRLVWIMTRLELCRGRVPELARSRIAGLRSTPALVGGERSRPRRSWALSPRCPGATTSARWRAAVI